MSAPYAAPTAFDVAFWLLERGHAAGQPVSIERLNLLLFLAHRSYAPAHGGQDLMPACFGPGPEEPNVTAALGAGLANPWPPRLERAAQLYLDRFWGVHGAMPTPALKALTGRDSTAAPAESATPAPVLRFTADGRTVRPWRPKRSI